MSLTRAGVWKAGLWAPTVWANGVWYESAVVPVTTPGGGGGGGGYGPHSYKSKRLYQRVSEWVDAEKKEEVVAPPPVSAPEPVIARAPVRAPVDSALVALLADMQSRLGEILLRQKEDEDEEELLLMEMA